MTDIPCHNTGAIRKRQHSEPARRTPLLMPMPSWPPSLPLIFGLPPAPVLPCFLGLPLGPQPFLASNYFLASHPFQPPGLPPFFTGLAPHHQASHPALPPTPFSASQPLLHSHLLFSLPHPLFDLPPLFLAGHRSPSLPFLLSLPPFFEPPTFLASLPFLGLFSVHHPFFCLQPCFWPGRPFSAPFQPLTSF